MEKHPISYLIETAEMKKEEAWRSIELGDPLAERRFTEWGKTLEALRVLRDSGMSGVLERHFTATL